MENLVKNTHPSQTEKTWSIVDVIRWGESFFHEKGIEMARLTIESILTHVLNCKRIDLYLLFDKPLIHDELARIRQLVQERIAGKPLQYILGTVEFYDTTLTVCKDVLIPRPETELMVDLVVKDIKKVHNAENVIILDLGTGSGNIAISLAKKIETCKIFAADISSKALEIARKNAHTNGVCEKIHFFQADMMRPWKRTTDMEFDYIVSNPPYVSLKDAGALPKEVYNYEPHEALFAGEQGTEFHQKIINCFGKWLKPAGKMYLELGIGQDEAVRTLFSNAGFHDISTEKDYHSIPRIIYAVR